MDGREEGRKGVAPTRYAQKKVEKNTIGDQESEISR